MVEVLEILEVVEKRSITKDKTKGERLRFDPLVTSVRSALPASTSCSYFECQQCTSVIAKYMSCTMWVRIEVPYVEMLPYQEQFDNSSVSLYVHFALARGSLARLWPAYLLVVADCTYRRWRSTVAETICVDAETAR